MNTTETETSYLVCSCGGEQLHRLTYVHGCLLTITCEQCGKATEMPRELVLGQYARDFRSRLWRLPAKVRSGVTDQPVHFLLTLPLKMVGKVDQTLREVKLISRS
jgi:hypothetical protein